MPYSFPDSVTLGFASNGWRSWWAHVDFTRAQALS
jgi:hypothetical protein